MLHIPEILGHGQSCLGHAHTGPRWFIHLSKYQGCLFQHPGLPHLGPQVISLTGTLSHTRENGISAVFRCYIGYQLLYQHGLAHACTAKEAYLSSLGIGGQQINYLNTGL